ncbi:reelin domain-containing protein 1 [Photinus pyralis]|uniref:reelin domain-containing protein 1 n=1 Tax=Photinus pyralis TaxID=7054 RepID=UPI0012677C96|nr:reelin domain-containing protein 1 [Photinus pyralis]
MMDTTKWYIFVGFVFGVIITSTVCFPDGAPIDACVKPKVNQPNHSRAKPQSPDSNPYQIIASHSHYGPGTEVTVTIEGNENFKGFLIQARDVATNQWIGEWSEIPNTNVHPECSAITHADPEEKQKAVLTWHAPKDTEGGQVYFTGTVLKSYKVFWSNLVNLVPENF